jgi:uncharacterized protein YcbK (DUF882 family)
MAVMKPATNHLPSRTIAVADSVTRRQFVRATGNGLTGIAVGLGMGGFVSLSQSAMANTAPPGLWQQPRVVQLLGTQDAPNVHGEFEYWRDGRYQMEAYLTLSRLCADGHAQVAVQMDPRVFDLMFATQRWYAQVTGKTARHQITSAYRTRGTNQKVGGSPGSQHLMGRALDGRLLGLDLATYAQMLRAFGAGGVGLYAHHVHWDVGRSPTFWRGKYHEQA